MQASRNQSLGRAGSQRMDSFSVIQIELLFARAYRPKCDQPVNAGCSDELAVTAEANTRYLASMAKLKFALSIRTDQYPLVVLGIGTVIFHSGDPFRVRANGGVIGEAVCGEDSRAFC